MCEFYLLQSMAGDIAVEFYNCRNPVQILQAIVSQGLVKMLHHKPFASKIIHRQMLLNKTSNYQSI